MDAKALAKSKRAHSLHHSKKHHPNPKSKAPVGSVTATSGKKPTSEQDKDEPHQSRVSKALPSNWDRYAEEIDPGSEESPQVSTSKVSDVVAPKSKGADYAYLISEAKAQSQTNYSSSGSFDLFDDVLSDFHQGLGPLLSVRGQRTLSWISDDNFLDDKGTSSGEAPFFSLNLHSLAEQLSKANLAERLFIEPDVLPPELFSELQASNEKFADETQATYSTEATETAFDWQASNSISKENRYTTVLSHECMPSNSSTSSSVSAPPSVNQPVDDIWRSGSTSEKLTADVNADSVAEKSSRFEATVAEAELDMLLDSFSETKLFDSTSATQKSSYTSFETQVASAESVSVSVSVQQGRARPDSTYFGSMDANLDDTIDDLLKETSSQTNLTNAKGALPVHEVNAISIAAPSASQPNSKSKILDDFDSWLDTI